MKMIPRTEVRENLTGMRSTAVGNLQMKRVFGPVCPIAFQSTGCEGLASGTGTSSRDYASPLPSPTRGVNK